ncbi:hypothetical protein [Pseudonocardia lacus]|uniref:hypothetical protein n=1 Tax=Pseudonocardia lacus TaxID=2835865 RepID=UPI001BDDAE8A|nr:hypothetical protein [Pseudonocardia lacus]
MRPPGVRQRVQEVGRHELALVESRPQWRLRVRLTTLIDVCARLYFDDHPVSVVLKRYRQVDALLAEPGQARTGTDFEARCLRCVERLRPVIGAMAVRPVEEVPFDEQGAVAADVVSIPPQVVLGQAGPGSQFDLLCWNQANSVAEGVQRPYRAARAIAAEGFHEPVDVFGLIEPMTELTERYEDRPQERPATAAEIVRVLDEYRAAAPWPVR